MRDCLGEVEVLTYEMAAQFHNVSCHLSNFVMASNLSRLYLYMYIPVILNAGVLI
jgi:hypothetical protein